jgi:hypothetical protein
MIACLQQKCRDRAACCFPVSCEGAGPELDAHVADLQQMIRDRDAAALAAQPTEPAPLHASQALPFERGCWDWLDSMRVAARAECRRLALVGLGLGCVALAGGTTVGLFYAGLVALGLVQ